MKYIKKILDWEEWKCYSFLVKNTIFEIQFSKWKCWEYFYICFKWTRKQDHAGLGLDIQIMGFEISLSVVDRRHWDLEKNNWEN